MNEAAIIKTISPIAAEKEAAQYLNLSPSTLELDRRIGRLRIPYIKIGKRIGYLFCDLDKWIEAHRVLPSQTPNNDEGGSK